MPLWEGCGIKRSLWEEAS